MAQPGIPPQQYQPQYVERRPPVEYLRPLASDFLLAIGIIIGLFLMMIGSMIMGAGDSETANDLGNILKGFGNFIACAVLFLAAIVRVDIDKLVRFGFLLAAAILVAAVGFWSGSMQIEIPSWL